MCSEQQGQLLEILGRFTELFARCSGRSGRGDGEHYMVFHQNSRNPAQHYQSETETRMFPTRSISVKKMKYCNEYRHVFGQRCLCARHRPLAVMMRRSQTGLLSRHRRSRNQRERHASGAAAATGTIEALTQGAVCGDIVYRSDTS
jgi:hypothetical protein